MSFLNLFSPPKGRKRKTSSTKKRIYSFGAFKKKVSTNCQKSIEESLIWQFLDYIVRSCLVSFKFLFFFTTKKKECEWGKTINLQDKLDTKRICSLEGINKLSKKNTPSTVLVLHIVWCHLNISFRRRQKKRVYVTEGQWSYPKQDTKKWIYSITITYLTDLHVGSCLMSFK